MHDDDDAPRGVSVKRLLFDWSSVAAIVVALATYFTLAGDVKVNTRELSRKGEDIAEIKAWKEERAREDLRIAGTMARREDVEKVADQVRALAAELRAQGRR